MQDMVIKAHNTRGTKVAVNSCCFSPQGNLIVGGCSDGSVQIWDKKIKSMYRPQIAFSQAHSG